MAQNDDQLQQQYQEILNKYASSLTPPVETPESPIENKEIITPIINSTISPEPVLPVEPKPVFTPPIITKKPTPLIYFPPEPTISKPSNFFKYLFYFSLLFFIAVASAIIYNFSSNQSEPKPVVAKPIPTTIISQFCEIGDKKYAVGQSFASDDSCNTCSCTPDLIIVCTQAACAPTSLEPSTKPVSQKIYKDIKYDYQFSCPTTDKYQIIATSVDGNTIPFKKETCTDADSVAYISVYDNTVVHSFADIKTVVLPDKKYIITFEGDYTDIYSTFKFL